MVTSDTGLTVPLTETGPFAGSNPALGTTQALIDRYSVARNKYKPRRVNILFIAESPPSSGGFFYFGKTIGKDHLFRETMKALELWPRNEPMPRGVDKRSMLQRFQSMGFYLLDTCTFPVDKLGPRNRREVILRQIPRLVNDVIKT